LKNTRVIVASADARAAVEFEDEADLVLIKPVSVSDLGDLGTHLTALN